jgi:uncharacterized protein (UPF0332 family)
MKILWCISQGMKLIDPNDNLSEEYYASSKETLVVANLSKNSGSNMWIATHKYYVEYLAAYSLLMKFGIKSEIHSCTIEVIRLLEKENIIPFHFSKILDSDKDLRIDNQYYLKNIPVDFDSNMLAELLLDVRKTLNEITKEDILHIRHIILEQSL